MAHFIMDANLARAAIWTGGTDLAPVTDPLNNLSRVKFNSALDNVGFLAPRTGTIGAVGKRRALFSHGLGYYPSVWGYIVDGGVRLPIRSGSLLITRGGINWSITIAADRSSVWFNAIPLWEKTTNYTASWGLSYSIWLSNYGRTAAGGIHRPPYFAGVDANAGANPPYFKAGYFHSSYRYAHLDPAGLLLMTRGRTISFGVGYGNRKVVAIGYRQSIGGHTVSRFVDRVGKYAGSSATFSTAYLRASV